MRRRHIVVSESDERRLRGLLAVHMENSVRDSAHLEELRSELERAVVMQPEAIPAEVITMNSRIRVLDLDHRKRCDYTLVFPTEADVEARRISVLAPLGTALLGFRKGDELEWAMPGGVRRLRVERVSQPGADGFRIPASMSPYRRSSRVLAAN
jgi:regulator of nucleoside diphosphate kinase